MKKLLSMSVAISMFFCSLAESKPKAEAHFRVTDDLPKQGALRDGYSGVFSVTNTGEIAFIVITDKEWSGEAVRFYREGDEEWQRLDDEFGQGKQKREQGRKVALDDYYLCIEKNKEMTKLQPGESISFDCIGVFKAPLGAPGNIYKAEMYLGNDTWVPVHITPTLGTLFAVSFKDGKPTGDFYYSQEGTNQWLYVKTDDDKFKRVSEMKLDSKPQKAKEENAVTFEALDGTKKKLTREQARQIINDAAN